jgi:hypothetical protein
VLFLNTNGTVKSHQKISSTEGGFTGILDDDDRFGTGAAALGDLDGDGVGDLAVGARNDDDGGLDRGAVWVLFLNPNGTVKSHQKISSTEGGFTGALDDQDLFSRWSMTSLGDLDGDGVGDLAVGANGDDDGGAGRGAVWVLFLNTNGTVKSHQKISDTEGGFTGTLDDGDSFGMSAAALGDLDGDGVCDLAAGATGDDDGGSGGGAVWVLTLNTSGKVESHQKISDTAGGFTGIVDASDEFGSGAASLGDLDGDRVRDLAVGASGDDDGGTNRGAVWILFLDGAPACIADLDTDGDVGFADLLAILSEWGPCPPECPEDLDRSGDVGFGDLLLLLSAWGSCPQPGACCLPDGSCVQSIVGGSACAAASGTYHGDDTLCAEVVCPQPGACCLPDGSCFQAAVGLDLCPQMGGVYHGDDTLCADVRCISGACCLPDGSCVQSIADACAAASGTYHGDDTDCADVVCPQPGACCFPGGTCTTDTEPSCESAGGTFAGAGVSCVVADCIEGACCMPSGSCLVMPPGSCDLLGGTYHGDGSACETVHCP